jgi:hypothetical protein
MSAIDNESPPGSWQREIELQPWKYPQQMKVEWALYEIRLRGLRTEAEILGQEITFLKAELKILNRRLREKSDGN